MIIEQDGDQQTESMTFDQRFGQLNRVGNVVVSPPELLHEGFCRLERRQVQFKRFDVDGWCQGSYEYINKPAAVALLPYDPILDRVVLTEQFRVGSYLADGSDAGWSLETVAGIIDGPEQPDAAARRELQEETGLVAQQLIYISDYFSCSGFTTEKIYLYLTIVDARVVSPFGGLAQEHENIKLHCVTSAQLFELLDQHFIRSAASLILVQWFRWQLPQLEQLLSASQARPIF